MAGQVEDLKKTLAASLRGSPASNKMVGKKYVMVLTEKLMVSRSDPDSFYVVGVRQDTDERVTFQGKRLRSGQTLPEPGAMVRFDKIEERKQFNTAFAQLKHFNAEYFHAYGKQGFAVKAVASPREPRMQNGMLGATTLLFDTEVNCFTFNAGQHYDRIEEFVAAMLRPWHFKRQSGTTHDMVGKPIWSKNANLGITPSVMIRVDGVPGSRIIYGLGAVLGSDNAYRLPAMEEIVQKIRSDKNFSDFMHVIQGAGKEQLGQVHMTIVPGAAVRVGRESVQDEQYLGTPRSYVWENREARNDPTKPASWRGYKESWVHLQRNVDGRMMVVDCHPVSGARLSGALPVTRSEKELQERLARAAVEQSREQQKVASEQRALSQNQPQPQPQPTPTSTPVAGRQPVQAPAAREPAPAQKSQPQNVVHPDPRPHALEPEGSHYPDRSEPPAADDYQDLHAGGDSVAPNYEEFESYAAAEVDRETAEVSSQVEEASYQTEHDPVADDSVIHEQPLASVQPGDDEFDEQFLRDLEAIESMQSGANASQTDAVEPFHEDYLREIERLAVQVVEEKRMQAAERQIENRKAGLSGLPRMG
ncbi:hypothetical protein PZT66_23755 [Pseudomonas aeruginosa]|uniref:hypothetical protein n=1 Tax=Pseudomonas aeruginosa TaxID=287 RepID=UPI0005B4E230|nr:hypothetical protein [Pseudomonas aeruginosa]MBA5210243.1 hypothetical protein [Pseudomonas aeruginosa]MBG5240535.1 hypothetical protein [Pseudomonas aeruginosa]MBV6242229.1 hypothetical protein [Pseudomonas aeruginosa]MBX5850154.1 hypothetical protein [Pseudomonas aeruginosa]MCO1985231.1 hypothetical protein [Pseudomonas aeruginosa]